MKKGFTLCFRAIGIALAALVFTGCLDTKFPIASDDPPKVDRNFVGDWTVQTKEPHQPSLVIRNWDNKEYYVEWSDKASDPPLRMRGFLVNVDGASFANLLKLEDDGSISDSYLIIKVSLKDDVLTIQNLDEHFFKDNPPADGKQLRAIIAKNLANSKMYDDEPMRATRTGATAQPTTKP
jgi:hypothetical protein